jgi:hypothetical protein
MKNLDQTAKSIEEYVEGYIRDTVARIEEVNIDPKHQVINIILNYRYLVLDQEDIKFYQKIADKHSCSLGFHISPIHNPDNNPYLRVSLRFAPRDT